MARLDQALILPGGLPAVAELRYEPDGEVDARTIYSGLVEPISVFQSRSVHWPSAGQPIRVRGHAGKRLGAAVYWVERGYLLSVSPARPRYLGLLEWRELLPEGTDTNS